MDEMMKNRIEQLDAEIEAYRQAIEDAEGALDAADKELNEMLSVLPDSEEE